MEKVKFIIRVFDNRSHEICYLKTKSGLSTKLIQDSFEFNSIEEAKLCANKLGLFANFDLIVDFLLKYGDDLWQRV